MDTDVSMQHWCNMGERGARSGEREGTVVDKGEEGRERTTGTQE